MEAYLKTILIYSTYSAAVVEPHPQQRNTSSSYRIVRHYYVMPGRKRNALEASLPFRPAGPKKLKRNAPLPITVSHYIPLPEDMAAQDPLQDTEILPDLGDIGDLFGASNDRDILGETDTAPWASIERYAADTLPELAKPISTTGGRYVSLATILLYWRVDPESVLREDMQPPGPAQEWSRKLWLALAKLAQYTDAEEAGGVLWMKWRGRESENMGVLTADEVWEVVDGMKAEGREVRVVEGF
ncbi:hypothetical protein LTR86_004407 [Recurvomyces mirabilis]|nr:hypothetical protein LTR86_004407 [Recurvomyces mirabilis]